MSVGAARRGLSGCLMANNFPHFALVVGGIRSGGGEGGAVSVGALGEEGEGEETRRRAAGIRGFVGGGELVVGRAKGAGVRFASMPA